MKIGSVIYFDIANGPGIRVSLFVSGCNFRCKGCFNQRLQNFDQGIEYNDELKKSILQKLDTDIYDGLSILGGDPLCQDDDGIRQLIDLCSEAHKRNKTVWIWSGYTLDELCDSELHKLKRELISNCDVFIDGKYDEELRDLSLPWRGSSNQKMNIINNTVI